MPTRSVPADVFFRYNGVNVYYVFKNDDRDCGIVRDYAYSMSADSCDDGDEAGFDVRELDTFAIIADKTYQDHMADDRQMIRGCIAEAIDDGELDDQIDQGGQTIPNRFINHYSHCGENWTDASPAQTNDRCVTCGAEIEPHTSTDIEAPEITGEIVTPVEAITPVEEPFVMVREDHPGGYTIKIKRKKKWMTVAETYLIRIGSQTFDAKQVADRIAELLNTYGMGEPKDA